MDREKDRERLSLRSPSIRHRGYLRIDTVTLGVPGWAVELNKESISYVLDTEGPRIEPVSRYSGVRSGEVLLWTPGLETRLADQL